MTLVMNQLLDSKLTEIGEEKEKDHELTYKSTNLHTKDQ